MFNSIQIGIRMNQRREELGLTLDEVASAVKVTKSTIQRYETGQINRIKLPVIMSIANALAVNPDWMLGLSEEKETDDWSWDGYIIKECRKKMRETPDEAAEALGISTDRYISFENSTNKPSVSMLCKFTEHFMISFEQLVGGWSIYENGVISTSSFIVSQSEQHLIELYRQLNAEQAAEVKGYIKHMISENNKPNPTDMGKSS